MNIDQILQWGFFAFIGFAVIQIFYIAFFYLRVVFFKTKTINNDKPEVSVIIAARNESENLQKNLSFFLEQDYPKFMVIVVNDASVDDSETILAEFQLKYKNLYVTNIRYDSKFKHGKKTALNVGIKAAKTEILLFSDADCKPESSKWIENIVRNFDDKTDFVIGFGGYKKEKGLLNKIIRSDTVLIGLQYLSFAISKIPYMAVGRNMAYKKSLFVKNKGFANQMNLLSGSDDLFVNNYANRKNLKVELSPQSFTISETKKTTKQWFVQKIRHLTTGKYYKFKHKFLLSLEVFSRVVFLALSIALLVFNKNLILVSSILFFRFVFFSVVLSFVNKKLNQKGLLFFEILYDIFQPFLNLIFYIFASKKKEMIWK
ncbi:MAG: glycosyltransferase [Bacteroidales bacterium]|nr:glycosyltransferase [Bacteroidales bacterium]